MKKITGKKIFILFFVLALLVTAGVFLLNRGYDYFMKRNYPLQYTELVEQEAAANGLDPALVYAVIRTESRFQPDAHSHANAYGLMQMTPETFSWVQTKIPDDPEYETEALYEPAINIRYGCKLLNILMDKFEYLETALCAYNAGIGIVSSWLENDDYSSDGKTISNIPYPETENYVQSVIKGYEKYRELYQFKTQEVTE